MGNGRGVGEAARRLAHSARLAPGPQPIEAAGSELWRRSEERRIHRSDSARGDVLRNFGHGWEHAIVVEKKLLSRAGQTYPVCVEGKRHGPPEDCGGAWLL